MIWLHVLNGNKIPAVENSPSTNIPVNKSLVLFLSCCWQKRNNNSNNKKHNTKQSQPSNQANNHSRNQSIGTYPWCSWISKSITFDLLVLFHTITAATAATASHIPVVVLGFIIIYITAAIIMDWTSILLQNKTSMMINSLKFLCIKTSHGKYVHIHAVDSLFYNIAPTHTQYFIFFPFYLLVVVQTAGVINSRQQPQKRSCCCTCSTCIGCRCHCHR